MLENELKRLNENLEKGNGNITQELQRLNNNLENLITHLTSETIKKEVVKEEPKIIEVKKERVKEEPKIIKEKVKEVESKPKKLTKIRLREQVEMLRMRAIDLIRRNITTTVEIKKILTSQGYENFNALQEVHLKDWENRIIQWENTLN